MKPLINKKILIIIGIVLFVGVIIIISYTMKKNETTNSGSTIIVKRSVAQGDFVYDNRKPEDACSGLLNEVKKAHPGKSCSLIEAKRVDSNQLNNDETECVDGVSLAGCFACKFEVK